MLKKQDDEPPNKAGKFVRTTASLTGTTAVAAAVVRTPMVLSICVALAAVSVLVLVAAHVIANGKHAWRGSDPGPAGRVLLLEPLRIVATMIRRR